MTPHPPAGTITFLFSDIEGSTSRWERDPDAMAHAVRVHDWISAAAVRAAGGTIFKTTGDGICAAFSAAAAGVEAALELRRRLAEEAWPATVAPLRVRMAVHTGTAEERDGDYFGPTLNRVARLMSVASGGQILVSEATRQLLPDGPVPLRDLGEHRLRDLLRPVRIYQVGDERHPALRTLDAHDHNLPSQVTTFVGRERELADLRELIPASPVVTLTGPGGTGKTRLALQVAAELVGDFDSVVFVSLTTVADPAELGRAIADALGLQIPERQDVEAALVAHLTSRRCLLLLDNFEQLVSAAPLVGALVEAAPDLRIIVTSRELLRLRAERNFPVDQLAVPAPGAHLPIAELAAYESMRLFEVRARAVVPEFRLDETNVQDVADLCRRLDGLPLAIELAAARVRMFTPGQLRSALRTDLGVLGGGPRDAPVRHQKLVDTIRWSYDLLDEVERIALRRLAIFVGGCSMEALEVVVLHDQQRADPVTAAEALADKSLVRVQEAADEPRIDMLETIRAFARSELAADGEVDDLSHRHAAYLAELAERAEPELRAREQATWMRRLDTERQNMQAALAWSFGEGHPESGLRMVAALRDYWFYQGLLREMGRWVREALPRLEDEGPILEAGVLLTAGFHAYAVYQREAPDLLARAAELYEAAGDDTHRALALIFEAGARENLTGDIEAARRGLEEGIAIARRLSVDNLVALGLTLWGELERAHGNYAPSRDLQDEALEISRRTGESRRTAMVLNNLGLIAHHLGDDEAADRLIRESLRLSVEIGFDANAAHSLIAVAEQIALRGDPERGARLIGAADAHFERLGLIAQPGDAPDFERIRRNLGEILGRDFAAEVERGRRLDLEEAVELALSV